MASNSLKSAMDKEQEDPIRCIFFAEFHHIAGPKITCQVRPCVVMLVIECSVCVCILQELLRYFTGT